MSYLIKRFLIVVTLLITITLLTSSCSENYSNGERVGTITRFSHSGMWFKSWEGYLNVTQTGMNSSGEPFEFSIDNDDEDERVIKTLDSAARYGWKVKLNYHQVMGFNWFGNRGNTDYFISSVDVLDKNFTDIFNLNGNTTNTTNQVVNTGRVVDTIYVVIDNTK